MSNHQVTPLNPEEHVCRVGYDRLVDSFFLYVARPLRSDPREHNKIVGDDNGHVVKWLGTTHREIDTVERLAELLAPYATLPQRLSEKLRADRERERDAEPKALEAVKG